MFQTGQQVYIQFPQLMNQRELHPASIADAQDGTYTATAEQHDLPLANGQELLLYFETDREFMQMGIRIEAVLQGEEGLGITFRSTSEPVSAESRQCYRVSTVIRGMSIDFGRERNAELCDVSATGFCVVARTEHQRGNVVEATITYSGRSYTGKGVVQSIRVLDDGRRRYGVHVADGRGNALEQGLSRISMDLQREQLRRMSGAA